MIQLYFSDFFRVSPYLLEKYGAFNISLINDLPVFIDPFLIFNSKDPEYQQLHEEIIRYVRFLRAKSLQKNVNDGLLKAWFHFGEVRQNWLGYSEIGNKGSGLGPNFARKLNLNLYSIFSNFGQEKITRGSHLEKLCLIGTGVGRDNISDFTTNLIKDFLLKYTATFARQYIDIDLRKRVAVNKVRFNYATETWESDNYEMPIYEGEYILLTPKNILTRDEMWISKKGIVKDYDQIIEAIPNDQLRAQINNYFMSILPDNPKKREISAAIPKVVQKFPQLIDYYIRYKEDEGDKAVAISDEKILETELMFIKQIEEFVQRGLLLTDFYERDVKTHKDVRYRVQLLKSLIEDSWHKILYINGNPFTREKDLRILFRLIWFATPTDKLLTVDKFPEFKLATNKNLQLWLQKVEENKEQSTETVNVVVCFSVNEIEKVEDVLKALHLKDSSDIILIDARVDSTGSYNDSNGIEPTLYSTLRKLLISCGPLSTQDFLKSLFVDKRISLWQTKIPEAGSEIERAEKLMKFLYDRFDNQNRNGLVLFLNVLKDRTDENDACFQALIQSIKQLESNLQN